ncbi:hypothetical protein BT67DRAFT_227975 [Trichocladium antarcticum]|uniref:Uncharacterized protein n=1 Tax=Trichocladium antarcticum TaxID=1450529 RepID=A0AAN6Z9X2_9PEZI|nr:hypothetical protein BT67DRAFT_227975 [Trichocladium antarcticum]
MDPGTDSATCQTFKPHCPCHISITQLIGLCSIRQYLHAALPCRHNRYHGCPTTHGPLLRRDPGVPLCQCSTVARAATNRTHTRYIFLEGDVCLVAVVRNVENPVHLFRPRTGEVPISIFSTCLPGHTQASTRTMWDPGRSPPIQTSGPGPHVSPPHALEPRPVVFRTGRTFVPGQNEECHRHSAADQPSHCQGLRGRPKI